MNAQGALTLLLACVAFLAFAVVKKLLVDELSGWLTALSEALIRLASARLSLRAEHYRAQWLAHLAALEERRISGLRYALSVLRRSRSLAALESVSRASRPEAPEQWWQLPDPFTTLYERIAPCVLRFFARGTVDPQHAVGLTAETFAKAFERRLQFAGTTFPQAEAHVWSIAQEELARTHRTRRVELSALERLGLERSFLSQEEIDLLERLPSTQAAEDQIRDDPEDQHPSR